MKRRGILWSTRGNVLIGKCENVKMCKYANVKMKRGGEAFNWNLKFVFCYLMPIYEL